MAPDSSLPALAAWHRVVAERDLAAFEAFFAAHVADEAVFISPALHKPQVGKALMRMYLGGAVKVLGNEHFRYVGEWHAATSAVLEFETRIGDLAINGVDIIEWNQAGQVVRFKVMVRPYRGLEALMAAMRGLLTAPALA